MSRTYEQLEPVISALDERINAKAEQIDTNTAEITELKNDGVAPSAEQLLSKNTTADTVPYHFRQTGGNGADREYLDAIVGGTVGWNQLVNNGNFADTSGWTVNNGTFSVANNVLALVASSDTTPSLYFQFGRKADHKYLISIDVYPQETMSAVATAPLAIRQENLSANTWTKVCGIATYGTGTTQMQQAYFNYNGANSGKTTKVKNYMLFDLTAMFGSTIADYIYSLETAHAGDGVALFRSLFPNDYYAYSAAGLESVQASAHKMTGFNQWDEEWELGGFTWTTAQPVSANDRIRAKNFCRCMPNTEYYNTQQIAMFWYDEDKTFISYSYRNNATRINTSPSNAHYFKVLYENHTTYNHDICINLSDPAKNGTYEPYEEHSYPLDSTLTLRGIPKLDAQNNLYYDGDRYLPDGTVQRRYGIVDLGSLDWSDQSANEQKSYYSEIISNAQSAGEGTPPNVVIVGYTAKGHNGFVNDAGDKALTISATKRINVNDNNYASAQAFKTAMSGVYLVYELATPTTEQADPYISPQICDPNGTEEYVSTGIVPIGHNSFYPENLRAKVEQLPWNFANLIAPTESTFTATRNYTTGSLFIVDNVLYKATANIANGGTITPNTNCTATTLAEIISALA